MAAEELKQETQGEGVQLREREKIENPQGLLQENLDGLNKFGGFSCRMQLTLTIVRN